MLKIHVLADFVVLDVFFENDLWLMFDVKHWSDHFFVVRPMVSKVSSSLLYKWSDGKKAV